MELGSLKQMDLGWRRVVFSRETEMRLLGKNSGKREIDTTALGAGQSSRCCYVLMTGCVLCGMKKHFTYTHILKELVLRRQMRRNSKRTRRRIISILIVHQVK